MNYALIPYYSDRVQRNLSPAEKNFGFDGVATVAIGRGWGTVLLNDGRVVGVGGMWGSNPLTEQIVPDQQGRFVAGQVAYYVPTLYSGLTNIVSLPRVQSQHGLALRGDGCVMSWGSNAAGQTGQGNTTTSYSPVATVSDAIGGCFKLSNTYQVAATSSNLAFGSVVGVGTFAQFQPVRLSAKPVTGYSWSCETQPIPISDSLGLGSFVRFATEKRRSA